MLVLHSRRNKPALLLGVGSVLLYAVTGHTVSGPEQTPWWLLVYALQWTMYLALFLRAPIDDFVASGWLVMAWAALARAVLVTSPVWLSDDLYRYLLDGRMLAAGINPFRYAPADAVVQQLQPDLASLVNHPQVHTVYPPTIQALGWVAAKLSLGVNGWRALLSGIDLAVVASVARLFGGGARGWRAAAVYGLCPLAVWEAGANGHLEPAVALPLVWGVVWWYRRPVRAGLAWGLAILAKFYPALLLLVWWREKNFWRIAPLAAAVTALGLLPFFQGGVDMFAGMRVYLEHWQFNSPLYRLLSLVLHDQLVVRAVPYALVMAAAVVLGARGENPQRAMPLLVFGFLVLGPTLHPWYALWVLPWLGDRPHTGLWSFVAAMGGAYAAWWEFSRTGLYELPPHVPLLLWMVVAMGWIAAWWRDPGETGQAA